MTLVKAHKLISLILKNKKEKKVKLLDKKHLWNTNDDFLKDVVALVVEGLDNYIEWLKAIKKQLPPLPNCKHPKEMHDRCDGQLYCMDCNKDL